MTAPLTVAQYRRLRVERQRAELLAAIAKHGGNLAAVARELGMIRPGVHYRCARFGLLGDDDEPPTEAA